MVAINLRTFGNAVSVVFVDAFFIVVFVGKHKIRN